jgi:hypothetical protein
VAKPKRKLTEANYKAIRDRLFDRIHTTGEQVKNDFPNILRTAITTEAWKHFADAEGKPFTNLVEWLHYTFPHGVGLGQGQHTISYDDALLLTKGAADVHKVLQENRPKLGRGRPSKDHVNNDAYASVMKRGASASQTTDVLAARLAQEHPEIYDAYLRAEHRSIRAAAEAAGLVKPANKPLPRLKSNWKKATERERQEFLKWIHEEGAKTEKK